MTARILAVVFVGILCAILAVTALGIILLVKQTTKPLSNLVKKISNARTTQFNEHIIPRGIYSC